MNIYKDMIVVLTYSPLQSLLDKYPQLTSGTPVLERH